MAGGIAQGRQNPGLVSKAGGWVPSDSHFLSEPQVPTALSSRGHLPASGMWLRSSVLFWSWLGLGSEGGFLLVKSAALTPHPGFQRLGSALSISGPICRNTQNFHPLPGSRQRPSGHSLRTPAVRTEGCQVPTLPLVAFPEGARGTLSRGRACVSRRGSFGSSRHWLLKKGLWVMFR